MSAAVDLLDLIEQHGGGPYVRKSRTDGGEYGGPCPFCGGRDRFMIWPAAERPHYWCRVCEAKGGVARFLVEKGGLGWHEAIEVEREGLDLTTAQARADGRAARSRAVDPGQPSLEWQAMAEIITQLAEAALWNERDPTAEKVRRYLRSPRRGLRDETIRTARLGYIPQDIYDDLAAWGLTPSRDLKKVWLPRGVLIPYVIGGQVVRLKIRRLTTEKAQRFHDVAGSANALYGADNLAFGCRATLSESEFDALVARQEVPEAAHCATGGTNGAREPRWLAKLALADTMLVTFDPDEAGDGRAAWWLNRLRNAARLRPIGGDLTEMHCTGDVPLAPWFAGAFGRAAALLAERSTAPEEAATPVPAPAAPTASGPAQCFFCAGSGPYHDREGRDWCAAHAPSGAIDPATGEVFEIARREMSSVLGACYWCGERVAVVDTHGRAWCTAHAPGNFSAEAARAAQLVAESETIVEEAAPSPARAWTNEEILGELRATLVEGGADFSTTPDLATPARATKKARAGLPELPRCSTPHCEGSHLEHDALGNLWCRLCTPRREMMDSGATVLGEWYPDLAWGTTQRTGQGEKNWLMFARGLSLSAVHLVLRAVREKSEQPDVTQACQNEPSLV